ncbi:MAG: type II secretion system F family protein [Candidatus Eremiobacteraeota bacterium]|nr:type II secretion system F family protein [Candidatus Eremiobacteraeota bacterium]
MSTPLLFGILVVLLVGGLTAFYYLRSGNDVHRKLAALNLDAPAETSGAVAIHKLLDDEQKLTMERRLQEAGWYDVTPTKMTGYMLAGAGVGGFIGILFGFAMGSLDTITIVVFFVALVAGFAAPQMALSRAIEARKKAVQRDLPNFLDIVSTSVEAGTALSGALTVAADAVTGPLRKELELATDDIRLGRSRSEALAAMAHRLREPDLTTTVTALVQAERLGGNIVEVLAALAAEARERRTMRAEELAAQLPVKMVFPMTFFMLPSLVLMIGGAVIGLFFK